MQLSRRNWLRNASGLLVAAPFVVCADRLMKVALPQSVEEVDAYLEMKRYYKELERICKERPLVPLSRLNIYAGKVGEGKLLASLDLSYFPPIRLASTQGLLL